MYFIDFKSRRGHYDYLPDHSYGKFMDLHMDMNSSHTEGNLKTTTLSEQTLKQLFSCSLSALKRKKKAKKKQKKKS